MKQRRSVRERLSSQRSLAGLMQTHPSPVFAEMAGLCGYDFLIFDGEHGVFSEADYLEHFRTLAGTDALSMVRLAGHDAQALGRYLDMGAEGIVVPGVSTADQARALARAMTYPPHGTRGFGASAHRTTRYGLELAEHLKGPRGGACLLVIIESATGVANADGILAVEGIDGVIIGPADLSADLGAPRDFLNPAYVRALERVEKAAAARKKILGTAPHPGSPLEVLVGRGHHLLILDSDISLIREAMSAQLALTRASQQSAN